MKYQPYSGEPRVFIAELAAVMYSNAAERHLAGTEIDCAVANPDDHFPNDYLFPIAEECSIAETFVRADQFFATNSDVLMALRSDCEEIGLHVGIQTSESETLESVISLVSPASVLLPLRLLINLKRTRIPLYLE